MPVAPVGTPISYTAPCPGCGSLIGWESRPIGQAAVRAVPDPCLACIRNAAADARDAELLRLLDRRSRLGSWWMR